MEDQNKVGLSQTAVRTIINLNKICRFCLSETKSSITINDKCPSEGSKGFEEHSIYNFVTELRFIKMEDSKNFPSQVCEKCYSLLKICKDFSQLCQKSDILLRDCYEKNLKQNKEKAIHKDDETEIKIVIQMPNAQENEVNLLDYNIELLPVKKPNIPNVKSEIQNLNQSEAKVLQDYKQKLNFLSGRLKEVQSKLITVTEGNTNSVVKNDQYTCSQCSLKFSSVRALNFHNIVTHNQRRFRALFKFQCRNCLKSFSDQIKLKRHYKIVHKINKSELPNEYLNNRVKGLIQGVEKFFCFHCNPHEEFQTQDELIKHLQSHKLDVSQLYPCAYCKDLTFPTRVSLNEHLLVHKLNEAIIGNETSEDLKPSNMLICLKPSENILEKSQNLIDLSRFLNILDSVVNSLTIVEHEKESGFKLLCKTCIPSLEFTSPGDFISHVNTCHDGSKLFDDWVIEGKVKKDSSWDCIKCPASYSTKQSLYCHMKEKHKQSVLDEMKCPEPGCSEFFNTNRQLIQHGIAVHQKYYAYFHKVFKKVLQPTDEEEDRRVKNFECDICQKKYIYKTSLRKHIYESHLEKSVKDPVICSYCGKTLSSKLNLKSHIEFMHEALFVSCPICKKKINFRTIGKHYKTHKTSTEMIYSKNSFLCNQCGKILKSKRSFEDHQKLHKNIRDEVCDICGSGFTTKKFLRLHKKIHEGVQRKIYGCDQCDKVFSGRQTLNRHLLTHSGKKNFICEICSKCFYTLQELNRHVRYHKKEYRFDCQLCDMRFLDKSRFRYHMMRHRNVRPHKCQFCEKMFIVKGKMNLHMAAKHNVEVQNTKGVWKDPKNYVPLDDLL